MLPPTRVSPPIVNGLCRHLCIFVCVSLFSVLSHHRLSLPLSPPYQVLGMIFSCPEQFGMLVAASYVGVLGSCALYVAYVLKTRGYLFRNTPKLYQPICIEGDGSGGGSGSGGGGGGGGGGCGMDGEGDDGDGGLGGLDGLDGRERVERAALTNITAVGS